MPLYVDATDDFLGHGITGDEEWIVNPFIPGGFDAFHSSVAGHAVYADAIRAVR